MEKVRNFFSKHGLIAFIVLFFIMMVRGCSKNGTINKLNKENSGLNTLISAKDSTINNLESLIMSTDQVNLIEYKSKSEILDWVNNSISKYDRNSSMMELQFNIIDMKNDYDSKIKDIEKK